MTDESPSLKAKRQSSSGGKDKDGLSVTKLFSRSRNRSSLVSVKSDSDDNQPLSQSPSSTTSLTQATPTSSLTQATPPPDQTTEEPSFSTPQTSPTALDGPSSLGDSTSTDEKLVPAVTVMLAGSTPESDQSARDKKEPKEKKGFFSSPRHRSTIFPFPQFFASSHRHRNADMHKIFSSLPDSEKLIDDFSCALQRDILIHGRLYLTQNWICFYANIFSWETLLTIPFQSVQAITKEKTALVIPNAIQVVTTAEKYGFSSLMNREVTYNIIFKVWQNCLLDLPLSPLELVKAARRASGDSSEVGDADSLWGKKDKEEGKKMTQKQRSMPTHVELGVLPDKPHNGSLPSTAPAALFPAPPQSSSGVRSGEEAGTVSASALSSNASLSVTHSLPVLRSASAPNHIRSVSSDQADTAAANNTGTFEALANAPRAEEAGKATNQMNASNHMTMGSMEHPERWSLGGDSMGSEFETVSFTEETGEVPCGCNDHVGRTILNEVFQSDVETIFQLLFTDSDFIRNFFKARKTINVEMGEWQSQTDFSRLRDISYTLALNYSFGPKFARSTEHQIYSKMGQLGLKHVVDTEVVNHDIPYSDTFFVSCRYCMTRVAHNKTRVRVTANINFKKTCWGLVKNLIERNAGDGLRSHYTHLDNYLKEYLKSLPVKKKVRRRKRPSKHRGQSSMTRAPSTPPPQPTTITEGVAMTMPSMPPTTAVASTGERSRLVSTTSRMTLRSFQDGVLEPTVEEGEKVEEKKGRGQSIPRVNLALTLLLGILIVSNMALYYHLMSYQGSVITQTTPPSPEPARHASQPMEWPSSKEEWISLVREQLDRHEQETERWRSTLQSLVRSLEEMESSLSSAKKSMLLQVEHYSSLYQSEAAGKDGNSRNKEL